MLSEVLLRARFEEEERCQETSESDEADAMTESTGPNTFCAKEEQGLAEELENICSRPVGKEFAGSLNINYTLRV